MAVQFDPIAKDESLNTTEPAQRNIADVLAQELSGIATAISGGSDKVPKTDIATVEPTNVASRAYSVGELVYVNGNLYKVITAIASGATFTVNTNIQNANVSGALKDIRQPRTIICGVFTGTSANYITFAHEFPKSLPIVSIKITQVFYIGLPPQPTVNIPIVLDTSSGTDMSIPYAFISDATMMNNMRMYATSVEIEITYA